MSDLLARFLAKTDRRGDADCWEWLARRDPDGYGTIKARREGLGDRAHRVSYALLVGPIPDGLVIDHLCRNRGCVNPAHLEPVTNGENLRRGDGVTSQNFRATHCKRGHEFTPENTYLKNSGRRRVCRACLRLRAPIHAAQERARKARLRAARVGAR